MNNDFEESESVSSQTTSFAQRLAKNVLKDAKLKNPPIILKNILDSLDFKITLFPKDLGDDDGFCVNNILIGYNQTKNRARIRFTIAHELGHILLGHNAEEQPSKINFYSKNEKETVANAFAAELLVPSLMLKKEILKDMSVVELAKKYDVSDDMMFWRLKTTHLDLKVGSLDIKLFNKNQQKWKV
jgi:Zn-dependent peptidase ImmA (M78 family)